MTWLIERLASLRLYLDHLKAIRTLGRDPSFPPALITELERLPGFRNIVVHEYVTLDMRRVIEAMDRLGPVEQFVDIVRALEEHS